MPTVGENIAGLNESLTHWKCEFHTAGEECKMVQPHRKTGWQLLRKLNTHLPCNPVISSLGTNPREMKARVHAETCTRVFTAALFVTATN